MKVKLPVDIELRKQFIGCTNVEEIEYTAGTTGVMKARKDAYGTSHHNDHINNTLEYQSRENLKTVTFRQNDEYGTEMNLKAKTTKLYNETGNWFEEKSRISRFILKYDENGLLVEQQYVGLQNVPVNDSENIHGMRFKYDDKGHKIEEQFIDLDGNILKGRSVLEVGAHCAGHNSYTIGVVYVGGLSADGKRPEDTRTPAQKVALLHLLQTLVAIYHCPIYGHRDFARTACPSFDAKTEYVHL